MSLTDDDKAAPPAVAGKQAPQGDASPAKPGVGAPSPKKTGAPNSKPIDADDTYVYRDFATMPAPATGGAPVHPNSLQAQKLPAKLATMLSDQGESIQYALRVCGSCSAHWVVLHCVFFHLQIDRSLTSISRLALCLS